MCIYRSRFACFYRHQNNNLTSDKKSWHRVYSERYRHSCVEIWIYFDHGQSRMSEANEGDFLINTRNNKQIRISVHVLILLQHFLIYKEIAPPSQIIVHKIASKHNAFKRWFSHVKSPWLISHVHPESSFTSVAKILLNTILHK